MRLYFVRHGESEANTTGLFSNRPPGAALTAAGREQAESLAVRLHDAGITQIYSSPLLRARQTAEILSAALNAPVEVTDALREYDMGIYEGTKDPVAGRKPNTVLAWTIQNSNQRVPEGGVCMRRRFEPLSMTWWTRTVTVTRRWRWWGTAALLALLPMMLSNVRIVGPGAPLAMPMLRWLSPRQRLCA